MIILKIKIGLRIKNIVIMEDTKDTLLSIGKAKRLFNLFM